jgi:AAA family ATP:ADP antiporter
MRDRLFQLLGIEHGEESMVSILLTQSVFLGIFYGAFDISAHSLFLAIFDEKVMARAYVISGFTGIILTGLYTWLQARVRFRNFAIINLIFVSALTLILWLTLRLNPSKWVIFTVFVMLGPLNILAMLGFWGTTGRLFSLRQGKRLFGLVDAGLILGVILSSYAIPVLLSVKFKSHNILLLSSLSVLIAALIQIIIGQKFTIAGTRSEKSSEKRSGLSIFREDSYIRIMGIFIALSVMTAFFVQYSFMAVTREQYPLEEDMARFLGFFTGSMMVFTLLLKVLVFSYIVKNYGLKTCLAVSPFIVAGFTAIAIGVGMFMGFTPASGGFILFFLLLALSRLFSKSLKDSIESPSFKVIYQTIDEKVRYEVQSGIDGTINEISALFSGLILSGLGALVFVKLIHFSWFLFFIIIGWIFVALRLYSEYRSSIRKSLEAVNSFGSGSMTDEDSVNLKNRIFGEWLFKSNYYNLISGDLSSIDKSENRWFLWQIIDFAGKRQDLNLLPSLKKIGMRSDIDKEFKITSASVIEDLEIARGKHSGLKGSGSEQGKDVKITNARNILSGSRLPQTTEILRLLRDTNIESKRYAIYIIGKFRLKDMLNEVCECLNIPGLENDATAVIEHFGASASDYLYRFFFSSGNIATSKILLRLICKLSLKEYPGFMFSRLWSNSRQIKEVAVKCLIQKGYKANNEEKDKLHQIISEIIGTMTWNISAQVCLERNNDTFLLNVLKKETALWNNFLFNIASIAYDPGSLAKIRENLESGTVESVNYALEMIDIVIDDSIKPKLISLLDVVPDEDKLKNLHQFYPGEIPGYDQLMEDILNRDYNLIGIWSKACTLRNMTKITGKNLEETVLALLFTSEKVIQEEAARLIGRTKIDLYHSVSGRIKAESKNRLDKIVAGEIPDEEFLYEKKSFLSSIIPNIPDEECLYLASAVKFLKNIQNLKESELRKSVIWNLHNNNSDINIFLPDEEMDSDFGRNIVKSDDSFLYILPVSMLEEYQNKFPESTIEIYKYFDLCEKNLN